MKIDDRQNALDVARTLVQASLDQVADALLSAHLEGLNQALGLLNGTKSLEDAANDLRERRNFVRILSKEE